MKQQWLFKLVTKILFDRVIRTIMIQKQNTTSIVLFIWVCNLSKYC